ncbi:hypothetical protein B0H16DRAFT_1700643 [Mycena metata]|uniref:Uncharacterized protein n=1 Tax=Mycena metata TaxID=1033252 RepID=A0AAD7HDX1_9AGAR|nr:hypothetical protein B0H16DRAFT_1700643 [Mycena metata]
MTFYNRWIRGRGFSWRICSFICIAYLPPCANAYFKFCQDDVDLKFCWDGGIKIDSRIYFSVTWASISAPPCRGHRAYGSLVREGQPRFLVVAHCHRENILAEAADDWLALYETDAFLFLATFTSKYSSLHFSVTAVEQKPSNSLFLELEARWWSAKIWSSCGATLDAELLCPALITLCRAMDPPRAADDRSSSVFCFQNSVATDATPTLGGKLLIRSHRQRSRLSLHKNVRGEAQSFVCVCGGFGRPGRLGSLRGSKRLRQSPSRKEAETRVRPNPDAAGTEGQRTETQGNPSSAMNILRASFATVVSLAFREVRYMGARLRAADKNLA